MCRMEFVFLEDSLAYRLVFRLSKSAIGQIENRATKLIRLPQTSYPAVQQMESSTADDEPHLAGGDLQQCLVTMRTKIIVDPIRLRLTSDSNFKTLFQHQHVH